MLSAISSIIYIVNKSNNSLSTSGEIVHYSNYNLQSQDVMSHLEHGSVLSKFDRRWKCTRIHFRPSISDLSIEDR
jgi:DNA recombination-dependent growth factor C